MKSLIRKIFVASVLVAAADGVVSAANPFATDFSWDECRGSARPYPVPRCTSLYPDSLIPVMINHVGRHGARYPASMAHVEAVRLALDKAEAAGTITPAGISLRRLAGQVAATVGDRWGALDSLGAAEQRGIAARMYAEFPELFDNGRVSAVSSYVPRCVMSMYEFCHEISRLHPKESVTTESGTAFSHILRFFDSKGYKSTVSSLPYTTLLDSMLRVTAPMEPLRRVLGRNFPLGADSIALAIDEYSMLAGLDAMGLNARISDYMTPDEYNALWAAFNLRQYVDRTATTLSSEPADISAPLLMDIISTTDRFISGDTAVATVNLRFGHAETLMPLMSLMRLRGAYYLTHNFETVGLNWQDFNVVPMAANIRFILFRSISGRYYVRVDHNEIPVPLLPGSGETVVPWNAARAYLLSVMPVS